MAPHHHSHSVSLPQAHLYCRLYFQHCPNYQTSIKALGWLPPSCGNRPGMQYGDVLCLCGCLTSPQLFRFCYSNNTEFMTLKSCFVGSPGGSSRPEGYRWISFWPAAQACYLRPSAPAAGWPHCLFLFKAFVLPLLFIYFI